MSGLNKRLGEQEIAREARRILRRIAAQRVALCALENGRFAVARDKDSAARSRIVVEAAHVEAFLAAGWIANDGAGRFVITAAGGDFVTRAEGGEDGFAAQHRLGAAPGPRSKTPLVNAGESPLARLAFRQLIDAVQLAAGEKLRRDFTLAQLTPRMGVDLCMPRVAGGGSKGPGEISDMALAAKQRFARALAAVGPELGDLLFDVCCHLSSLELAETRRSWTKRSGRVVLKIALDRLAAHYGLSVRPRRHSPMRSWAMEDGVS